MKVVILGAGNVATHLAKALRKVNVQITQIWSYHYENAIELANKVDAVAIKTLEELDFDADICLVSIKDDAIPTSVNHLKAFKGVVVHTSGAVNINIFDGLANYGVFYPLQTFSKSKELSFADIPLCLEANNENTLQILKGLAINLSENVIEVDSERRKILHLAAVFACNFTNHLYTLADEVLKEHQLDFAILRPLINETAAKVQQTLPKEVQTGPAIRNDKQTIQKHEQLLLQQPQLLEIYKTLSNSIKKTR